MDHTAAQPRDLRTVKQFADTYPAWTEAALRALILNAAPRQNSRGDPVAGNGLAEAGAIVRVGRRVLISESRFFSWVAAQQRTQSAARPRRIGEFVGHAVDEIFAAAGRLPDEREGV